MERGESATWRTVVSTVTVAASFLLVAVAAGSVRRTSGFGGLADFDPESIAGFMESLLFVLYLALLAHAFYLWLLQRDAPRRKQGRGRVTSPWIPLLILLGVLGVRLVFRDFWDSLLSPEASTSVDSFPTVTGLPDPAVVSNPTAVGITGGSGPGLAAILIALAALGVLVYLSVRRSGGDGPGREEEGDLAASEPFLAQVSEHGSSDPRGRVIATYRHIERLASLHDLERRPYETVAAHLRRLPVDAEASGVLGWLYNRARFSVHPVTEVDASHAETAGRKVEGGLV